MCLFVVPCVQAQTLFSFLFAFFFDYLGHHPLQKVSDEKNEWIKWCQKGYFLFHLPPYYMSKMRYKAKNPVTA